MKETLSFNEKIFKYPPVQYIPMHINTLEEGFESPPGAGKYAQVRVWQDEESMLNDLAAQPFPLPTAPVNFKEDLVVLLAGGHIEDVKYRAHTVYMVGEQRPSFYHLFSLSKHRFYKQRLHFAFFIDTGERLAWDNILFKRGRV